MATAKLIPAKIQQPRVELSLTFEEARTLARLMNCVGGSPSISRRLHTDSIGRELDEVLIERGKGNSFSYPKRVDFGDLPAAYLASITE